MTNNSTPMPSAWDDPETANESAMVGFDAAADDNELVALDDLPSLEENPELAGMETQDGLNAFETASHHELEVEAPPPPEFEAPGR